jgi:phosphoglycolate phosphatase
MLTRIGPLCQKGSGRDRKFAVHLSRTPVKVVRVIRNIIFDWSGTLVDDLSAVWQATNYAFRQAGLPDLTLEEFRAEFRLPFHLFYEQFVPQVPLPQLESWFHRHFTEIQDQIRELPHARRFLQFCRSKGLRAFILSTMREDHFQALANRHGLAQYFERPYLGIWDKRAKIGEILLENQLSPRETLFVGDMEHDVETARHGGVYSCAVLTGYNQLEQLRRSQPDLIVEHLGELLDLLEQHQLEMPSSASRPGATGPGTHYPVATVGALIYDDGRVLMIRTHKWSNLWGIPGGKIKFGETAQAALIRETKEETGLDIADIELVLVQDCIRSLEFYREAHFVLLNYTCRTLGSNTVRLNEEAFEYRWVKAEEAFALPLNHPTRFLLETVQKGRQQPKPAQGVPP